MNYGTTGVGSDDHLLILNLEGLAGLQPMNHAPLAGSAPLLAQVLGGHIGIGVGNMAEILAAMREGRVRALGQAAEKRWDAAPRCCRPSANGDSTWSRVQPVASPDRQACRRLIRTRLEQASPPRWPIPLSCRKHSACFCRFGRWSARPWSS